MFIIKCKDVSLSLADDVSEEDVSSSIGCVDVDIRSQHNAGICERQLKYCMDRISARYVASLDDGSRINDPVAVHRVFPGVGSDTLESDNYQIQAILFNAIHFCITLMCGHKIISGHTHITVLKTPYDKSVPLSNHICWTLQNVCRFSANLPVCFPENIQQKHFTEIDSSFTPFV